MSMQPLDDLSAVLRAHEPVGFLDVWHEVVDVGQRGGDQLLGVRARTHEEIDGSGDPEAFGSLENARHRRTVDPRQDEGTAEVEHLGVGHDIPRHVILAQGGVRPDDMECRP